MRRALAASGLAALLLLAGCGGEAGRGAGSVAVEDDGWNGTHLAEPWQPSDLVLDTDAGKPFALDQDGGPLHLVFFGYTNCPDVCQVVMATVASAVNRLDDGHRARVEVDFVTTDPARDTPAVLRDYLDRFGSDFVGVTGPLDRVIAFAEPLNIHVEKGRKLPSGGYEVDHSAYLVGVRDGGARIVWNESTTPPDLAEDIEKLLEETS